MRLLFHLAAGQESGQESLSFQHSLAWSDPQSCLAFIAKRLALQLLLVAGRDQRVYVFGLVGVFGGDTYTSSAWLKDKQEVLERAAAHSAEL